jgi:hypothetical protein
VNPADRLRLVDAEFEDIGDQRRSDRRSADRRAPRLKLDPAFAATLINQLTPPERQRTAAYASEPKRLRPGLAFDLSA